MRRIVTFCFIGCAAICGCDATSTTSSRTDVGKVPPDNTAVNKRDRATNAKTPFDQSNAQPDLGITATIRQRIVDLPDLSLNARNVKVITDSGKVTLRGPVQNEGERLAIEKIAHDIAGRDNVVNEIDVAESE